MSLLDDILRGISDTHVQLTTPGCDLPRGASQESPPPNLEEPKQRSPADGYPEERILAPPHQPPRLESARRLFNKRKRKIAERNAKRRKSAINMSREEILLADERKRRRKDSLARLRRNVKANFDRRRGGAINSSHASARSGGDDGSDGDRGDDGDGGGDGDGGSPSSTFSHDNPYALLSALGEEDGEDLGTRVDHNTHKSSSSSSSSPSRAPVPKDTEIIASLRDCIRAAVHLSKQEVIAVDCEGCNLGRNGTLTLLQAATASRVFLFDILEGGEDFFTTGGLKSLLESDRVIKVMHDCRGDSDALYHLYGVSMQAVFDTQIAYAIISKQDYSYTPLPTSLNTILRKFASPVISGGNAHNTMKDKAKQSMIENPTYWNIRPMDAQMVEYARQDVLHLCLVYKEMCSRLSPQSRSIADSKSKEYCAQVRDMEDVSKRRSVVDGLPQYGMEVWDAHAKLSVRVKSRRRDKKGRDEHRRRKQRRRIGGKGVVDALSQAAKIEHKEDAAHEEKTHNAVEEDAAHEEKTHNTVEEEDVRQPQGAHVDGTRRVGVEDGV